MRYLIMLLVTMLFALGMISTSNAQDSDCEESILVMVDVPMGEVYFETGLIGEIKMIVYNHLDNAANSGPKLTSVATATFRLRSLYSLVSTDDGVRVHVTSTKDEGVLLRDLAFPGDMVSAINHRDGLSLVMSPLNDVGFRFNITWSYRLVETSELPKEVQMSSRDTTKRAVKALRSASLRGDVLARTARTPGYMWRLSKLLVAKIDDESTLKSVRRCVGRWHTIRTPNPPLGVR